MVALVVLSQRPPLHVPLRVVQHEPTLIFLKIVDGQMAQLFVPVISLLHHTLQPLHIQRREVDRPIQNGLLGAHHYLQRNHLIVIYHLHLPQYIIYRRALLMYTQRPLPRPRVSHHHPFYPVLP